MQFPGTTNPGGVETWLMNVLQNIDRSRFHFTFCVASEQSRFFDSEIQSLGAGLIHCPVNGGYRKFAKQFLSILDETRYDVVHSHSMFFSGVVMRLAKKAGVPIRISHSHNTQDGKPDSIQRYIYRRLMRRYIQRYATNGVGCSMVAADYLFTPDWRNRKGYKIATCAVNTNAFRCSVDRKQLLEQFNIPINAKTIGHVGNFSTQKNHEFLLPVFTAIIHNRKDVHLFLVGDGPLKPEMELLADKLGISDHVTFTGMRDDVPLLIKGLFDLLVFPSRFEGLGLVVVESQAAGVPCLISDVIPIEATVIEELVRRESLKAGPKVWAETALEMLESPPYDKDKAIEQIEKSTFDITSSVKFLSDLYSGQLSP